MRSHAVLALVVLIVCGQPIPAQVNAGGNQTAAAAQAAGASPAATSRIDPTTKDVFDMLSKTVGALGVFIGAISLVLGLRVRKEDLRWRKASTAREALTDIHKNEYAVEAVHLIDAERWGEDYAVPTSRQEIEPVSASVIRRIVSGENVDGIVTPAAVAYVRRCFDWLLYYLDRVGYQATADMLIDFEAPLVPYTEFINRHWASYFARIVALENYSAVPGQIARLARADLQVLEAAVAEERRKAGIE